MAVLLSLLVLNMGYNRFLKDRLERPSEPAAIDESLATYYLAGRSLKVPSSWRVDSYPVTFFLTDAGQCA